MLASCGSSGPLVFRLMPAPAAFTETGIEEYQKSGSATAKPLGVFFATDRAPAAKGDRKNHYYTSERGDSVRIGRATIGPVKEGNTWDEISEIAFIKDRERPIPIKVTELNEYGMLASSVNAFTPYTKTELSDAKGAEERYFREINAQLSKSDSKSINIYIHGFKEKFESPILTSTELWNFMGNDGVFIAYSWPATPKILAYVSDSETAQFSAHNLRKFIRLLGQRTRADTINIIAFSAGTRVLSRALADLALQEGDRSRSQIRRRLKLGTIVLLAGDVDTDIVGGYLIDGVDRISDQLILYQSDRDKALSISRFLNNSQRIGQSLDVDSLPPEVTRYLNNNPRVCVVDVSEADSARKGNGHGYLRGSPWVSSDLLVALTYGRLPEDRGLVRKAPGVPLWTFPEDYIERLRMALLDEKR